MANLKTTKYLFRWNKTWCSLENRSWNLYPFSLTKEKTSLPWAISLNTSYTVNRGYVVDILTFMALSKSEQLCLISEKGHLNERRKMQGKMSEIEFSKPFSTFSRCLFVHALTVLANDSRNWCREFSSLVCSPHKSLSESTSLDISSSSLIIPGQASAQTAKKNPL